MTTTSKRINKRAVKVTNDVQKIGATAINAAQNHLGQLRENASDSYEQGKDTILGVARSFEQHVRERPFQSLLIVGGVGLLLGRFWMRR